MSQISVTIPDRSLKALDWNLQTAPEELRLTAAIKLYEMGKLSSGAAAEFAGISRIEFLTRLADYGVNTFVMTPEELDEDIKHAAGHL